MKNDIYHVVQKFLEKNFDKCKPFQYGNYTLFINASN